MLNQFLLRQLKTSVAMDSRLVVLSDPSAGDATQILSVLPSTTQVISAAPTMVDVITLITMCGDQIEDAAGILGELPYNKLKIIKKFAVSLCKILDTMNIQIE